jgi:hypothetical protein
MILLSFTIEYFSRGLETEINEGSYMLFCKTSNSSNQPSEIIKFPKYKKLQKTDNSLCSNYVQYNEYHACDSSTTFFIDKLIIFLSFFILYL